MSEEDPQTHGLTVDGARVIPGEATEVVVQHCSEDGADGEEQP